jgi:subtilisin family serine protease
MRKQTVLTLCTVVGLAAFALLTFGLSLAHAGPTSGLEAMKPAAAPDDWFGVWQYGAEMDATVWGGPAGEGFARFSGHFYEDDNLIYFLGGRRESNDTTGAVFTFDPVTGVYADTGADLANPVSNYFISQIDNDGQGNGPGLYIVAGRMGTGVNTTDVQVYYPDINTAQVIATDPVPGAVRAVGGQAVANGKLYAFGGFDAAAMYDETYVYDPAAAAGARWSNTNCDLPAPRSYIATTVIGNKIYAIGGDAWDGASLVPVTDTLMLDTDNLGACWQDGAIADLPDGFANGDAPAVYVDEGYLAGGIYIIGGVWPAPGPLQWVFRYDVATDAWDVEFPILNQARRNFAAVYVPASAGGGAESLGDGVPGIWGFGGYDGTATNAMASSSEFFSIEGTDVFLFPDAVEKAGVAGVTVQFEMVALNDTDNSHTYDITYEQAEDWDVSAPASVGPVAADSEAFFPLSIDLPADADCPSTNTITVTVTAQDNGAMTDSQDVNARVACGVGGSVLDANNGNPVGNAFIWMEDVSDPLNTFYEAWTNESGDYALIDIPPATYRLYASALGYQGSFYPSGWPTGAVTITLSTDTILHDFELVGSEMAWTTPGSVQLQPGDTETRTVTLTNNGTGPLAFSLSVLDGDSAPPPPDAAIAGAVRIDQQLYSNLAGAPAGTADFVVMLRDQADLSAAYGIADWNQRGQYVYETLRQHAERSQAALRQALDSQGVTYRPLYIVNGIIVQSGNLALVESLAARPDVSQIIANHQIAIEGTSTSWTGQLVAALQAASNPTVVEWNIARVNADDVWNDYTMGEGIIVANIDSGVQYDHPALSRQYRGWDGVSSYDHNYNWWDPYHQGPGGGTTPADADGHGTHVMGTMIGEDDTLTNQIGVAPGARWIACDGGDDDSGFLNTNELLECAQWILAPWDLDGQNADPTMRPHVVNNSWGGSPNDYWYTSAVAAWRASGIFPAFANGNGGPGCSTAHSPGDYWNTFSAGATTNTDDIAGFSSRGPSPYQGFMKPDISAPGAAVRSSVPTDGYALFNGTSMASPHVAGSVALLWAAAPELIGQVEQTGWILQQAANPQTTNEGCGGDGPSDVPNNTFGYGILDIHAAVMLAHNTVFTDSWLTVSPLGGVIPPGGSMDIQVVFQAPETEGVYTATLWLTANDPYNQTVMIPIELNVIDGYTLYMPVVLKPED